MNVYEDGLFVYHRDTYQMPFRITVLFLQLCLLTYGIGKELNSAKLSLDKAVVANGKSLMNP